MFSSPGGRSRPPLIVASLFGARRALKLSATPVTLSARDSGRLITNFGASRSVNLPGVAPGLSFGFWTGTGTLTLNTVGGALLIFPDGSALTSVAIPDGGSLIAVSDGSNWIGLAPTFNQVLASTTVRGAVELATASDYRANTAGALALTPAEAWSAAGLVALTDGANIAVDMSAGLNFSVTLGGNRTLDNPTNTKVGQTGVIIVTQDATGGRTLAYGTNWEFAGGTAPTLSTAANAKDVLFYFVQSSTSIIITGIIKAVA